MGGPLAVHILKLFQCFDSPRDRTRQLGPVGVVEQLVNMARNDLFFMLSCSALDGVILARGNTRVKVTYQ